MGRAAIGFKPRTGRAILVAIAEDAGAAKVVERAEIPLLPPGEFAPYHAAAELEPKAARKYVNDAIARAQRMATSAVEDAAKRCADAGHEICGCAVLVGRGMPNWTTDEILAVHVRMHQAEGEMFRDILVEAVRDCGFDLTTLPDKTAIDAAAERLAMSRDRLDGCLTALGKAAGSPWGKYQKEAASAALVALRHRRER